GSWSEPSAAEIPSIQVTKLSQLWLLRLAALGCAVVGLINIASALTFDVRWRGHLLLSFEPVEAIRLFHAMTLPFKTALLLMSPYLLKRQRRTIQTAIALM